MLHTLECEYIRELIIVVITLATFGGMMKMRHIVHMRRLCNKSTNKLFTLPTCMYVHHNCARVVMYVELVSHFALLD
jgi:hypothetical protein